MLRMHGDSDLVAIVRIDGKAVAHTSEDRDTRR